MDKMNQAILTHLKSNSRMSWQQIGKQVHLTGQAVSARVAQLEEQGIISGYTIRQNNLERHFITVFMENPDFAGFEAFLNTHTQVESAFKVTGEGCYQLVFTPHSGNALELFLNQILRYGHYKVLSAIRCVK
jgi:Lrp/AsnC family leucine-responsive transcriptional regulator